MEMAHNERNAWRAYYKYFLYISVFEIIVPFVLNKILNISPKILGQNIKSPDGYCISLIRVEQGTASKTWIVGEQL